MIRTRLLVVLSLAAALVGCGSDTDDGRTANSAAPASPVARATPVASVASSAAPVRPSTPPTAAEAAGVYLALGDSITFGIGVPRPHEDGYVARVADALSRPPRVVETRVFAVPGETATGFLERRIDDVVRSVAELGPRVEVVTIGLGANDLLRTRREAACLDNREGEGCRAHVESALTEAAAALDGVVGSVQDALADAGSDARVLLLAYYNPDPDPIADGTVAGPDGVVGCDSSPSAGLNDRIACIAEARGVELVDLHAAFQGRELELTRFAAGDVHPNAAGYGVIADSILAVIEAGR